MRNIECLKACLTRAIFGIVISLSIAHAKVPTNDEPYSVRPDIMHVVPQVKKNIGKDWDNIKRAHLEFTAEILEMYLDREIYYLARDAELLYEFEKLSLQDAPEKLKRIHLLNVFRANRREGHIRDYLHQEGISEETLEAGKQVLFIDTGREGTIPNTIAGYFPRHHSNFSDHFIVSSSKNYLTSLTWDLMKYMVIPQAIIRIS